MRSFGSSLIGGKTLYNYGEFELRWSGWKEKDGLLTAEWSTKGKQFRVSVPATKAKLKVGTDAKTLETYKQRGLQQIIELIDKE